MLRCVRGTGWDLRDLDLALVRDADTAGSSSAPVALQYGLTCVVCEGVGTQTQSGWKMSQPAKGEKAQAWAQLRRFLAQSRQPSVTACAACLFGQDAT